MFAAFRAIEPFLGHFKQKGAKLEHEISGWLRRGTPRHTPLITRLIN
jgi:hypothetical protein